MFRIRLRQRTKHRHGVGSRRSSTGTSTGSTGRSRGGGDGGFGGGEERDWVEPVCVRWREGGGQAETLAISQIGSEGREDTVEEARRLTGELQAGVNGLMERVDLGEASAEFGLDEIASQTASPGHSWKM